MSYKSLIDNLDKFLAYLGIIISLIIILYSIFVFKNYLFTINGSLIFLCCFCYSQVRGNLKDFEINFDEDISIFKILCILFFLVLTACILIWNNRPELYVRPISFFVLISILAVIISLEILYVPKKFKLIVLIQILILGLTLLLSEVFLFSGVVGVDSTGHQKFILDIMKTNYIPTDFPYSNLPIFHLDVASFTLITDLPIRLALIMSTSFLQILIDVLIIFLLGTRLINYKVGLLASLVVVISNNHIFMGISPIATTICVPFLLIAIFLLFTKERSFSLTSIILLFLGVIVLTHTISSVISGFVLFIAALTTILYIKFINNKKNSNFRFNIVLFFTVFMFSWWAYASGHILQLTKLIMWGFNIDQFINQPSINLLLVSKLPIIEKVFNNIGMFMFYALSLIGCLYMLNPSKRDLKIYTYSVIALSMFAISYYSIVSGTFIEVDRWLYFTEVILSIPFATSIFILAIVLPKKTQIKEIFKPIIVGSLIFILTFVMITSPLANEDNNFLAPNTNIRNSFTDSEFKAVDTLSKVVNGSLASDSYSNTVINRLGIKSLSFDVQLFQKNFTKRSSNLIIVRNYILTEPFELYSSPYKLDYNLTELLEKDGFSLIYNSNSVNGYIRG